jgi:NAD(P)H dehydrogenase (quinone)
LQSDGAGLLDVTFAHFASFSPVYANTLLDGTDHQRFGRWRVLLYAITGITGKVGGAVARTLLDANLPVKAVVRDARKGEVWDAQGCEVVLANIADRAALAAAFDGAEGMFVLIPPMFDPTPGFPEARSASASLKSALETTRPQKVVCLSTIGAQAPQQTCSTSSA